MARSVNIICLIIAICFGIHFLSGHSVFTLFSSKCNEPN